MNNQLHHKWNSERTPDREASKEGPVVLKEETDKNKVTLKQNKPK
jgi:hypothetical protein